jgi:outer membrane protein TolC
MTLDLGLDAGDPTLPTTNYRAQLGVEVPLWHQRGPQIEREVMAGNAAQARANAERAHALSNLLVAFRTFEASTSRAKLLADGVVPAAEAAANATEESYALGRAPLVAVLDAERARIEVRLSLLEARAARAAAWIEVEHAVGVP